MNEITRGNRLPAPVAGVIHQNVSTGAVLFLPADEIYFGLNEVGTIIWSLLPPARGTLAELCDDLCAQFPDVERYVIEADVRELLADLLAHKLVSYAQANPARDAVDSNRP